jgi:predicted phosphoribosyltransferase
LRSLGARRLILAVPVCAPDSASRLEGLADEIVAVLAPERFSAVGHWYDHFEQTTDDEVIALLRQGSTPP